MRPHGAFTAGLEHHLLVAFDAALAPAALLVAFGVGVVHGLAPGHGKSLAAAYLVGARAGHRHAAALALLVAAMHTASVLVLGLVWWALVRDGTVALEAATRWGRLAIASVVLIVGVTLLRHRWHDRAGPVHAHPSLDSAAPWSWSAIASLAAVGGLLPSPTALLLLVSGLLTGRSALAVGMVAAFGLGLAGTVLVTGSLVVVGRDQARARTAPGGRAHTLTERLPLVGAAGVVLGGLVLCVSALRAVASVS